MTPPARPLEALRRSGLGLLEDIERAFDRPFGSQANPWRHLGALGFYLFWLAAATGIYLYIVFDTSVAGVYRSIDALSREQWWLGGIVRSLHRYASDAFVAVTALHLVKEFLAGRYHGFRWFSWLTGVPLIWLLFASGIGGHWLVWDELAQFSAIATLEWFDWLPVFGEPLVRNFLAPESVNDRLFSLLVFLHIGIPLFLLLGMWVHIQRLVRADVFPPRPLAWGTLFMLLAAALARPAMSHGPANLAAVPSDLALDWWYHFIHPLTYAWSPGAVWALAGGVTLLLALLPWLPHPARAAVAVVDLANCNGCGRCFADCPYAAVVMRARSDARSHPREAVVLRDLCAGCGICAGACPSATPFRSAETLVSGIDMPQLPVDRLRAELERALAALAGAGPRVVVFGCDYGADARALADPTTAGLSLLCTAMLPPSFVDFALRSGADGVLVTGCREGDCAFRLGQRWTEERLAGRREPHLRASVPPARLRIAWAGREEAGKLAQALEAFRAELAALPQEAHVPLRRGRRAARA